jgi:phosphoglycolate phosphatase-like HAD superfamily hydrolase
MTFRILSDFDGVWTDQALEAEQVKIHLAAEAARLSGISPDEARADFLRYEAHVKAAPERYGWAPDGRITAYVDEDPFCVANSIAGFLAEAGGERETRYREAVLDGGFETVSAFADTCFMTATGSYRAEHPPALVPGAREAIEELHDAGIWVTVVSNSVSEKVIAWFRSVGIDAGESAEHALHVRGAAGKQVLGEGDATVTVGGRPIHVDRPRYRAIVEDEDPDLVVGDVFSLDLALPHAMRTAGHAKAPETLVLRRHPHTPDWIAGTHADGAIDTIIDGVADLPALVAGLRG